MTLLRRATTLYLATPAVFDDVGHASNVLSGMSRRDIARRWHDTIVPHIRAQKVQPGWQPVALARVGPRGDFTLSTLTARCEKRLQISPGWRAFCAIG